MAGLLLKIQNIIIQIYYVYFEHLNSHQWKIFVPNAWISWIFQKIIAKGVMFVFLDITIMM